MGERSYKRESYPYTNREEDSVKDRETTSSTHRRAENKNVMTEKITSSNESESSSGRCKSGVPTVPSQDSSGSSKDLILGEQVCPRVETEDVNQSLEEVQTEDINQSLEEVQTEDINQSLVSSDEVQSDRVDILLQGSCVLTPLCKPPSSRVVSETLRVFGLPEVRHKDAFFSCHEDAQPNAMEVGGRLLRVPTNKTADLAEFKCSADVLGLSQWREILHNPADDSFLESCRLASQSDENVLKNLESNTALKSLLMGDGEVIITPCNLPPHPSKVRQWVQEKLERRRQQKKCAEGSGKDNTKSNKDESLTEESERKAAKQQTGHKRGDVLTDCTALGRLADTADKSAQEKHAVGSQETVDRKKLTLPLDVTSPGLLFSPGDGSFVFPSPSEPRAERTSAMDTPETPQAAQKRTRNPRATTPVNPGIISPPGHVESRPGIPLPVELESPGLTWKQTCPSMVHSTPLTCKPGTSAQTPGITPIRLQKRDTKTDENAKKGAEKRQLPVTSPMRSPNQLLSPADRGPGSVTSGIEGPTPKNTYGFKVSQHNIQAAKSLHEVQFLTLLSVELHISTRRELKPDPEYDPIWALFYHISNDIPKDSDEDKRLVTGIIVVDPKVAFENDQNTSTVGQNPAGNKDPNDGSLNTSSSNPCDTSTNRQQQERPSQPSSKMPPTTTATHGPNPCLDSNPGPSTSFNTSVNAGAKDQNSSMSFGRSPVAPLYHSSEGGSHSNKRRRPLLYQSGVSSYEVQYVPDETTLFEAVVSLVSKWDPDMLVGYEIQMLSWGYLLARAKALGFKLCEKISRVVDSSGQNRFDAESDTYGASYASEISITGRIVLNMWRLLKHEVALNIYSFENVAFHILHERVPLFSFRALSDWWDHKTPFHRWKVVDHYVRRCQGNIKLLDRQDFISRISEHARVFGILFYSVISRGSQFRVESMMLRIAKPMNYIPVSPSVQQRAKMQAPETIPLVMEPESRFYSNPVLVLDFQSLYPSIVIAYNYCFSTCLGYVRNFGEIGEFKFGATSLSVPPDLLKKLENDVSVSPNGVAFVKSNICRGVLPRMLEEILNTRIMVKQALKSYKGQGNVALEKMLDSRQLGLKLIANVTFGYTSAHYSGRMPCVEIGDSIVRKARETLERAIDLVNDTPKWGARVVYGDTDSMFVLLEGASKEKAFQIGKDIAETVTALNPKPVKLKFEKVYLPCVLQTKKRYVGYMYETLDQKEPVFDAKGIETVRRDSCPAVAKVLEKSLRILFENKDVSLVKRFVQRQCQKLMEGRVSMQDFTFAKEYRGMSTYKPGACVPALELTKRMLAVDKRSEPRVGERVPYVIVYGSPGLPLIQLVRRPSEVLNDPALRLNAMYYITKQILPPLHRVFMLMGVDVRLWYTEIPRVMKPVTQPQECSTGRKGTISQYFSSMNCPVCDSLTRQGLCADCRKNSQTSVVILSNRVHTWERKFHRLSEVCSQCCGSREKWPCVSMDCPIIYKLNKITNKMTSSEFVRDLLDQLHPQSLTLSMNQHKSLSKIPNVL